MSQLFFSKTLLIFLILMLVCFNALENNNRKLQFTQYDNCVEIPSPKDYWLKHIEFLIKIKIDDIDLKCQELELKDSINFSFTNSEGKSLTFEPSTLKLGDNILMGTGSDAGVYTLFLNENEQTSFVITVVSNTETNPFLGNCLFEISNPRCIKNSLIIIELDPSSRDPINIDIKKDSDPIKTESVNKVNEQYSIEISEIGLYIMIVSITSPHIFYGIKFEVIEDPGFTINRNFFIEGQESKISFSLAKPYTTNFEFKLKCPGDIYENQQGELSDNTLVVDIIKSCQYIFTKEIFFPIHIEDLSYLIKEENEKCKFLNEEFSIQFVNIPEDKFEFSKVEGEVIGSMNDKYPMEKDLVNQKFTLNKELITVVSNYEAFFYYNNDNDYKLFSIAIAFIEDITFDLTPEADKFTFTSPLCFPQPIKVKDSSDPLTCNEENDSVECSFHSNHMFGSIQIEIANKVKTLLRYKQFPQGVYSIDSTNPQSVVIKSTSSRLDSITKIIIQKKTDSPEEYLQSNDKFSYDINTNTITISFLSEQHVWYTIIALHDDTQNYVFNSGNIIGTPEPSFDFENNFYFLKEGQTFKVTLQFQENQTALENKERVFYEDNKMTCEVDSDKLHCTSLPINELKEIKIKLELATSNTFSEEKDFYLFTYKFEPDPLKTCLINGNEVITITLESFDKDKTKDFDAIIKSQNNNFISGKPIDGTEFQLIQQFDVLSQTPGKYNIIVSYNTKEQIIDGIEFDLKQKIIIEQIGGILSGSSEEQVFDITFDQLCIESTKGFTLKDKKTPTVNSKTFTCHQQFDKKIYKCTETLPDWPSGIYILSWENECQDSTPYQKDITLVSIALTEITPKTIDITNESTIVTLTYNKDSSNVKKIQIINKDTLFSHEFILTPRTDVIQEFTIKSSEISVSGLYEIFTVFENENENSGKTIVLYSKVLEISPSEKKVNKNKIINQITVQFINEDLFQSRFLSVTYQKGSDSIKYLNRNNYAVSKDEKQVLLTLPTNFEGIYKFEFKDIANDSTQVFTLTVIDLPTSVTLIDKIYFNKPIEINFDKEIKKNFQVKTSDSQFNFDISSKQGSLKAFILEIKPQAEAEYGKKKELDFLFEDEEFLTGSKPEIIIIDDNTYPQTITNKNIKMKKTDSSFTVKFGEELYPEYKEKFVVEADNVACDSIVVFPDKKSIELTCNSIKDTSNPHSIQITFFTKPLPELTVEIISCNQNQIEIQGECKMCSETIYNKFPYVENGMCVLNCSEDNVIWDFACYSNCIEASTNEFTLYLKENKKECVKECGKVHHEGKCIAECPSNEENPLYVEKKECVHECTIGGVNQKTNECIECKVNDENKPYCEDCPPGTFLNKEKKCDIINESNPVDDCNEYCVTINTQSCFIQNYKPICNCKVGFSGLTCEMNEQEMKIYLQNNSSKLFTEPIEEDNFNVSFKSVIKNTKNIIKTNTESATTIDVQTDSVVATLEHVEDIISVQEYIDLSLIILSEK